MKSILIYLLIALIAYLLGSISTGLLWAKHKGGPNLREVGSKNTGASNVLRTMGWKSGLITFLGDAVKAIIACLIGRWLGGFATWPDAARNGALLAGLCVVLGHNWPVFFQFKGGKGVASSCGVLLCVLPVHAICCFVLTIALIAITRYISLGSILLLSTFALMVTVLFWGDWVLIGWAFLMAGLCIYRHRANIVRLLHGQERKIGQKES